MEDLVKLVEAVKLVDLGDGQGGGNTEGHIPDGRVCEEGTGIQPVIVQAGAEGELTQIGRSDPNSVETIASTARKSTT